MPLFTPPPLQLFLNFVCVLNLTIDIDLYSDYPLQISFVCSISCSTSSLNYMTTPDVLRKDNLKFNIIKIINIIQRIRVHSC